MKCCCSRETFSIVFGCMYLATSIFLFFEQVMSYFYHDYNDESLLLILIYGTIAAISFLFLVAIAQRCPYLIIPWMILAVCIFYILLRYFILFVVFIWQDSKFGPLVIFLLVIFTSILATAFAIIWNSFLLFAEIRRENMKERREFGMTSI